ncbi:acylphosphatase [Kiloniella sp.]|uniref:acylphosphatase n=1 Tax=Kiloniella sp. TaxID=1938587 RepID=UPI003B01B415
MKQIRVLITGRVQGVWYRGWTVDKAKAIGVQGWVRNLGSGQVEAVIRGEEADVEVMVEACWHGPELAKVEAIETFVDTSDLEDENLFIQIR